jgi:hypothetical protein
MKLPYAIYATENGKQVVIAKTRRAFDAVVVVYGGDLNRVIKANGRVVWTVKDAHECPGMYDVVALIERREEAIARKAPLRERRRIQLYGEG